MSENVVTTEKRGGLAIVTLNRPDAMNALSRQLRAELAEAFRDLESDPEIRVAVLTGAGRAFCAGLDLKELSSEFASEGEGAALGEAVEKQNPVAAMAAFRGPVIGAINGVAITGGFELAIACDVLIGSTQARFADTHGRVGIMPGWGLSQKLSRLIGIYRAKELSLTGNFLLADQACQWGLLNRVVEPDELLPVAIALAEDMLSLLPEMLLSYKSLIDKGFERSFGDAMALEAEVSKTSKLNQADDDFEERRKAVTARGKAQKG